MHKLTTMSLKNRALIALITIVAAVFGTLSFSSLKQELIPSIEIPSLVVVTPHQGASAEVVATDVTDPIEKALQTVPGLRSTETTSSTGLSMVIAEFDYGSDTAKLEQKMTQSVSRISSILPENVTPEVMSFNFDDFPVIQLAVSNDDTEGLATKLNDLVVPELERLDGVASASVLGAPGQRISITPDSEAMAEEGVDTEDLASLLANYGILMPAGTINDDGHNMAIEVGERLGSAEDIADIPLPPAQEMPGATPGGEGEMPEGMPGGEGELPEGGMPDGEMPEGELPEGAAPGDVPTPTEPEPAEPVLVGDIADVELVDDPVSSYSLINGERALTLSITKTPDANTVEVSHLVRDAIPHLKELVSDAEFDVLIDQAPFIEESISSLGIEGLLGLVMAVLVILLFLRSGRATLVTAVSIPTSLLIAFVSMQAAGYTLNMLSLGGLTIAIGRIVDDSIVVIENVERHMRYGKSRRDTIVDAVREVGAAITASTITTVAVFLPIALVGGMSGVLFRPFAFTVTVAMLASLLVALTIVPVLAYWFLKWRGVGEAEVEEADELTEEAATQGWIQKGYSRMLDWVIRRRWSTVAIAVVVLIGTVALAPMMKTNFLGDMGQNEIGITQSVTPGTSLDEQLEEAEEVNDVLVDVDGVETVAITIGSGDDMMSLASSEDSISYSLTTDEDGDQGKIEADVRSALEGVVDDEDLTISPMAGMGMSNDVEISITGAEPEDVESATEDVTEAMRDLPEARQVANSITTARPTVSVTVDRQEAAELGLTESAVSQMISGLLTPQQIGQITISSSSIDVYLTPETPVETVDEISDAELLGGMLTVDDVADVEVVDGPVSITTSNSVRNQQVTVTPDVDDIGQTSLAVEDTLADLDLPEGVSAEIGGITQEQNEAFAQLGLAMLIAILIVYVVMVATFRSLLHPLLLLVSVPFAATGALLAQLLTGIPLGVASLIGLVMLIGIVVTNAIVLIDLVKQYRDRGVPMTEALKRGAIHRVRPILMTAIATILALLPMGIGITGEGGFISRPLAVVVIGGLFSSTAMTLLVLPAIYHLVESIGRRGETRVVED